MYNFEFLESEIKSIKFYFSQEEGQTPPYIDLIFNDIENFRTFRTKFGRLRSIELVTAGETNFEIQSVNGAENTLRIKGNLYKAYNLIKHYRLFDRSIIDKIDKNKELQDFLERHQDFEYEDPEITRLNSSLASFFNESLDEQIPELPGEREFSESLENLDNFTQKRKLLGFMSDFFNPEVVEQIKRLIEIDLRRSPRIK